MRSFYILNKRASEPGSPESRGAISRRTGWRARLRYRDIIWAFHSETQGLLMSASLAACQGKLTWSDARALGVFLWLNSVESMVCWASSRNSARHVSECPHRDRTWKSSPGRNTWLESPAIQLPVHCSTSPWESTSWYRDSGGRQHGTRSRQSCYNSCPMISRNHDGELQHSRMRMLCWVNAVLVSGVGWPSRN